MKILLFPSLALASSLLAGCPDSGADGTSSEAANSPAVSDAGSQPEIPDELAKYNAKLPKKGELLPDIAGMTLKGKAVDNEWLKGKTALINLWFYH